MNEDNTITMGQFAILGIMIAVVTSALALTFLPRNTLIAAGASPVGTGFSTAKVALVGASFLTATSTSVLNTDANDRYIKNFEMACSGVGTSNVSYTGAGLASWRISASTSTTAGGNAYLNANGNYAFVNTFLGTSSPITTISSSTQSVALGGFASTTVWLAGTYLDIFTNATNTASCTVGVSYIPS